MGEQIATASSPVSERAVLIQKFGGTSVARPEWRQKVVNHVRQATEEGYRPVVVVSAMGRAGAPYATDTLIQLLRAISQDMVNREMDLLLSCGEIISAAVLAQTLRADGVPATSLTGAQAGIVTDNHFGQARILEVRPQRLWKLLTAGQVPVVAGFQGVTRDGEITTLGRGGSDTTAAALGVALRAREIRIYTDVDGVMTADPRLVPDARTLRVISYREVMEMAQLGAKVIHPRAVEIAMEGGVPLRVLQTGSRAPGTLITHQSELVVTDPESPVLLRGDRVVRAVTQIGGMARIVIEQMGESTSPPVLEIFDHLALAGISLDMIQVETGRLAFALAEEMTGMARSVLLGLGLKPKVKGGFVKVSVVGGGMQGVPGVMARVLRALAGAGVPVEHSSDSHANISLLVAADQVPRALEALHREFLLDTEDAPPGGGSAAPPPPNGVLRGLKQEQARLQELQELQERQERRVQPAQATQATQQVQAAQQALPALAQPAAPSTSGAPVVAGGGVEGRPTTS